MELCLNYLYTTACCCIKAYMIYVLFIAVWKVYLCFRNHVVSNIWKVDLKSKFGNWAVVTGCTSGIGMAYSHELAKRGINLILVSRSMKKLKKVSDEIKAKYHVDTEIIEADFSKGNEIFKDLENHLKGRNIGMLINNVGVIIDEPKSFEHVTKEEILGHLNVNMGAPTHMTNIILPSMIKNRRGVIINLSSIAAMAPVPYLGIYSASKAYNYYFSEALKSELNEHGIFIQTVTPGYVSTSMVKYSEDLSKPSLMCPTPEDFAAQAVSTIGYTDATCGYFSHELYSIVYYILPQWLVVKITVMVERNMMANLRRIG